MPRAAAGDGLAPVGICGTALTGEQARLLASAGDLHAVPPLFALDADAPGRAAAARHYPVILPWCPWPRAAAGLPDGSDPADVHARSGPQALRAALLRDRPLADLVVDAVLDKWERGIGGVILDDWHRSHPPPYGGPLAEFADVQVAAARDAGMRLAREGWRQRQPPAGRPDRAAHRAALPARPAGRGTAPPSRARPGPGHGRPGRPGAVAGAAAGHRRA